MFRWEFVAFVWGQCRDNSTKFGGPAEMAINAGGCSDEVAIMPSVGKCLIVKVIRLAFTVNEINVLRYSTRATNRNLDF